MNLNCQKCHNKLSIDFDIPLQMELIERVLSDEILKSSNDELHILSPSEDDKKKKKKTMTPTSFDSKNIKEQLIESGFIILNKAEDVSQAQTLSKSNQKQKMNLISKFLNY